MMKIERVAYKTIILTTLFVSVGVSANSHNIANFGMQNNANFANPYNLTPNTIGMNNWPSFGSMNNSANFGMQNNANFANPYNLTPNTIGMNNWPSFGSMNNWSSYNGVSNVMPMIGGANTAYIPFDYGMPYMPNNNWTVGGGNNNWGSFGAYNNMMPMMGINGAMPYTGYNNLMFNNLGMNQTNMNTGFGLNSTPSTAELTNAWGSLDANAAWGLGGDLNTWIQQAQMNDLSSQDPVDVIAQLLTGEHAAIYQQIIADAYQKGFADATTQSGSGGICTPISEELPEFNLEAD